MQFSVNIHSTVAVYVQIENQIRFAIASGRLKPGDQLPSVRDLSKGVEVNPNTVAKSYRNLEVIGLLYARRGMGVFINKGARAQCKATCRQNAVRRLYEVVQEAKASRFTKKDLTTVLNASYATDGYPYSEAPKENMKLAH